MSPDPHESVFSPRLATRMQGVNPSAVREILKVAERPDVLSFAGGLPAPELFPTRAVADAHAQVLSADGAAALQYSSTEGFGPLREWIAAHLGRRGIRARPDSLLVTSGSQQGIDLAAKILLDPGDTVLVENPTYLAALQAFAAYQVNVVAVDSDADGMRVDALELALEHHRPKLIYLVPEFQNPRGTSLALERRIALVALAQRHQVVVLEDDPYGELRFRGPALPPLAALDEAGLVIYLGTFSKTLTPGLRVAWMHASPKLLRAAAIAKQAADLHTGTLSQRVIAQMMQSFDYDAHVRRLCQVYGERCDAMLAALDRHMPQGTSWTRPRGGLFLWAQLPPGVREQALFERALERKVAFVPGSPFFVGQAPGQFMRLNFSNRPPELIAEGVQRLAGAARELLVEAGPSERLEMPAV